MNSVKRTTGQMVIIEKKAGGEVIKDKDVKKRQT